MFFGGGGGRKDSITPLLVLSTSDSSQGSLLAVIMDLNMGSWIWIWGNHIQCSGSNQGWKASALNPISPIRCSVQITSWTQLLELMLLVRVCRFFFALGVGMRDGLDIARCSACLSFQKDQPHAVLTSLFPPAEFRKTYLCFLCQQLPPAPNSISWGHQAERLGERIPPSFDFVFSMAAKLGLNPLILPSSSIQRKQRSEITKSEGG